MNEKLSTKRLSRFDTMGSYISYKYIPFGITIKNVLLKYSFLSRSFIALFENFCIHVSSVFFAILYPLFQNR